MTSASDQSRLNVKYDILFCMLYLEFRGPSKRSFNRERTCDSIVIGMFEWGDYNDEPLEFALVFEANFMEGRFYESVDQHSG